MSEELNTALMLMGIGMITVFFVLMCVVITGKILISFVNRFVPLTETAAPSNANIPASKIAAITSAVEIFTKGKGKITNIKKL
ncbi:MAG: OadG family protein [Reichenbachiella sp.]